MKKCLSCGLEKEYAAFSKNAKTTDGLQYWCKECTAKYHKTNYVKNKDTYSAYNKKYRQENAEKIREKEVAARKRNRDAIRLKYKKWYDKNREKIRAERIMIPDDDPETDLIPMIAGGFARWAVISTERRAAHGELAGYGLGDGVAGNGGEREVEE